jgi:hypothetical protein
LRPLIAISCVAFACLLSRVALAQNEGPAVPIEKAPYHLPVFKNEYLTVLKIDVPPHRNTGFHIHTTDSVSVNIEEADMANQCPARNRLHRSAPNADRPALPPIQSSRHGFTRLRIWERRYSTTFFHTQLSSARSVVAVLAGGRFGLYRDHGQ